MQFLRETISDIEKTCWEKTSYELINAAFWKEFLTKSGSQNTKTTCSLTETPVWTASVIRLRLAEELNVFPS